MGMRAGYDRALAKAGARLEKIVSSIKDGKGDPREIVWPDFSVDENDIVYRLRKRAEIRRQIPGRKSVQEGEHDRIADLLEEAADEIEKLRNGR